MALGTPSITDSTAFQHRMPNGGIVLSNKSVSALTSLNGNTKTPTANFTLFYKGQAMSFTKGIPFITDASLTAALNTAFSNSPPIA